MSIAARTFKAAPPSLASASSRRYAVRCLASASSSEPSARLPRRVVLGAGLGATLVATPLLNGGKQDAAWAAAQTPAVDVEKRQGEIRRSDEEWRELLGSDAYYVVREAGTERPFSSALNSEKRKGTFVCAGCSASLFDSATKYNSGTGWPSFYAALPGAVDEVADYSIFFMPRTEVRCHRCQGHVGHVFNDGPEPTGLRYCMNGLALKFKPAQGANTV